MKKSSTQMLFNYEFVDQLNLIAKDAANLNEIPVAAMIVDSKINQIIAQAYNRVETDNDPCAHAEILAIKKACKLIGSKNLNHCYLYVNLEPCAMCAQAISFARLKRLYFCAYDTRGGAVIHGPKILSLNTNYKPEIYAGIKHNEVSKIFREFFNRLRK